MAAEQISQEQIRFIKSKLMQLNLEYEQGVVDEETYHKKESEILRDLNNVLEQRMGFN